MAQAAVAPRANGAEKVGLFRGVSTRIRSLDLLPKTQSLGPVEYNVGLVAYVVAVAIAASIVAVVAILTVHVDVDLVTCATAGLTIFLMALFTVRMAHQATVSWVPTPLTQRALAVTFGPAGAAVGALSEATGSAVRLRNGWFRTTFNI